MRLPSVVTLDGVRIQELFSGFDPELLERADDSGIYDPEAGPPIEAAFRD